MLLFKKLFKYYNLVVTLHCIRYILSADEQQTVYVLMNMTEVFLNCSSNKEVAWERGEEILVQGGMKVTSDPRIQMIIDTHVKKLHIKDITSNYTDIYRCVDYVSGQITNVSIATYNVIVVEDIYIMDNTTSFTAVEGTTVNLTCPVYGRPEPNIKWYISSNPLQDIGISGNVLEIRNFTRDCEVPYMCIAKHNFTKSLNHTWKPITKFPPDVTANVDLHKFNRTSEGIYFSAKFSDKFKISCKITANPFYNVTWTKGDTWLANITYKGKNMASINTNTNLSISYDCTFDLKPINLSEHIHNTSISSRLIHPDGFGEYRCIASNEYGNDEQIINIIQKFG
ncbi:lachesin-like [Mytilus californianus]|uniref:lachesin-like n=1 Tax=Mytilus californianus TaxID=6549 RepID=UPI0022477628|nr:lachesin-like [Mytilus californianus]